jgi:Fe-S-cluster containining protein
MTEYDMCQECGGLCCALAESIEFGYEDRLRIANEFGMTPGEVTQQLSVPTLWNGERPTRKMKFRPCIFWSQGRCGVHSVKPSACAQYEPKDHCDKRYLKAAKNGTILIDVRYRE